MTPPECTIDECTKPARGRGWCEAHYARYRRHGDPLGGRWTDAIPPGAEVDVPVDPLAACQPVDTPDPRPVRVLRSELERSRALDASFALAWSNAVATALASLDRTLAAEWRSALAETRSAWRSAYFHEAPKVSWRRSLLDVVDDGDDFFSYRRSAPRVITTDTRHDGPSKLEAVVVPWCS
jgi:hypothetical protein